MTMNKMLVNAIAIALVTGCSTDADVASHNLSQAADQFEITRRIVFYNGITGGYMLTIEGLCSLGNNDTAKRLSVTCKVGPSAYKKHFLGLSDNVTFFVEQMEPVTACLACTIQTQERQISTLTTELARVRAALVELVAWSDSDDYADNFERQHRAWQAARLALAPIASSKRCTIPTIDKMNTILAGVRVIVNNAYDGETPMLTAIYDIHELTDTESSDGAKER